MTQFLYSTVEDDRSIQEEVAIEESHESMRFTIAIESLLLPTIIEYMNFVKRNIAT